MPTSRTAALVANVTSDYPAMAPAFRASSARPGAGLLRPVLTYAAVALVAVAGARLLADRGVAAPFPCGDSIVVACAAP